MYKVLNLIFLLYLWIHVIACLFYYVIDGQGQKWIPPLDFIYSSTALYEEQLTKKYLSMLYHSVAIFGLIEVAPRTELEVSLTSIILNLGGFRGFLHAHLSYGQR